MGEEITGFDFDAQTPEPMNLDGMTEFAEFSVEDDSIPSKVKELWWGFLGKDTILTRSDTNEDKWSADNDFAIRRNIHLMSQPAYKNDVIEMVSLDNIRRRFMAQHRRSIGGFERQALTTQIRELRTNRAVNDPGTGFFAGIKKKLGLGPSPKPQEVGQYGQ